MKLKKTFVGAKLNLDVDERLLPDGQYPYAENIRVIETNNANYGAAQNVKGNVKLTNLQLNNAITIGAFSDDSSQKLYWFVTSDEKDMVLEYDYRNSLTNIVLESTAKTGVLKFDKAFLITGVVKIVNEDFKKDLIIWTDDLNQPRCINIERAKTYGLDGFEDEDILLIKKPPRYAPKIQLTYTNSSLENYLKDRFFSFGYRYKYLDGEYSAISSFSNYAFASERFDLDYQTMDNKGMQNSFNAVNIIFDTGDKRVTDIELVYKESNSNTVFLIESFSKKKEMWGNGEQKSFKFYNSKRYTALPDDELYRVYDNVPITAKALELIGNRVLFGNYVEGYDLVNLAGEEINVDYDLSVTTNTLEGTELPISILNTNMSFDLTGIELKEGNRLSFSINLIEVTYNNGEFSDTFDLILTKTYLTTQEFFDSDDFKVLVESIMTNSFITNYTAIAPLNSNIESIDGFTSSISGDTITLIAPKINYIIDNTPSDPNDNPANTQQVTSYWNYLTNSSVFYSVIGVYSSLKSNRSYEAGIIYSDDFNRSTTTLTDSDNTIYIPQDNAVYQNKLSININSTPPSFATKYKFVVKQNKGIYYTIYSNFVYKDGLYAWFKLEGNNKDKVKEGDYIIVKADPVKSFREIIKLKVLEVKDQPKDFIDDNVDYSGNKVTEQAGIYMKVKAEGFSIDAENNKVYSNSANARTENKTVPPACYVDLFTYYDEGDTTPKEVAIPIGSRITLKFDSSFNYKDGWSSHKYERDFLVLKDYDNFEEWYNDNIADIALIDEQGHDYKNGMQIIRGVPKYIFGQFAGITPTVDGKLWLRVQGHETGGSGGRGGFVDATVTIVTAQGFFIFETEADNSDVDVYYETSQTFDIVDNFHQGNIQNQTLSQPAVVELDFFNCYVQGNGAESYQYLDSFNGNYLNIDSRPSSTSVEGYKRVRRFADLTYSEPYNENNNINGLNEFNLSLLNYKDDIDKKYGYIQKLFTRDNDIVVFQEDKISKVFYNKDLLMNSDSTSNLASINNVLGQTVVPYTGEYGISRNPESFAFNGSSLYFTDSKRGAVMRLAPDGLNEISSNGLRQFFKDKFKNAVDNKKVGSYDPYHDEYVINQSIDEKIPPVNITCSESIIKNNFTGDFIIYIDFGNVTGECGFSYTNNGIPVNIILEWGGVEQYNEIIGDSQYDSDLEDINLPPVSAPQSGTVLFNKTSKTDNIAKVTVKAPFCGTDLSINGICPLTEQGKVVFIVTNSSYYNNKEFYNRFKFIKDNYTSSFKIISGTFNTNKLNTFETISGSKGIGFIPDNNSQIVLETFYNSQEVPFFENGGRFGYYATGNDYTELDYQFLLDNMTVIPNTKIVDGLGNVTFRGIEDISDYKNLYIIYDYASPPIAIDDFVSVDRGYSADFNVVNNDINPTGNALNVLIDSLPIYGTIQVNDDRTISYLHDGSSSTYDSFRYYINDGISNSNIATVNITIIDNPPIAVDDYLNCEKGSSVTADIRENDSDPNNLPLTVVIKSNPTSGTVVVNEDGTITYTHNNNDATTDSFTYVVNNGRRDSNIATVYIDIAIGCDQTFNMEGGQGFFEYNVSFGTAIGQCGGTYNMYSIPDKFEIIWDGNVVATTGTEVSGTGTLLFEKTTPTPTTAIFRVTAPTSGTQWTITGICPNANVSARESDRDVQSTVME